jgi:hypothetical protein
LPPNVKIKDVTEIAGEMPYTTAIYSDTPEKKVDYSLKIALFSILPSGPKLILIHDVQNYGYFCGTRTIGRSSPDANDLLLYTNEPSGSSDYVVIHSFLIAKQP